MSESGVFHDSVTDDFRDANGAITDFPTTGGGAVSSVFSRTGAVAAATSDYDAVQVDFTPAGTIAATNTQAAVEEVATDAASALSSEASTRAAADAALVPKSLFDANSILKADSDDTPAALTMGASTILARLAAGNIVAATPAELRTLLALVIGTNVEAWDADLDALADLNAATGKTTPVDADLLALADSAASFAIKKLSGTNLKAYLKTYFDTLYTGTGSGIGTDGWVSTAVTLTYSSADAPTYVCTTGSDLSGTIPLYAKIKLTHAAATKYFIVTAIDATTITLYGGTDYTLAATAITAVSWSSVKAPYGFPLDQAKWTLTLVSDTSDRAQASPVSGTWYNLGSLTGSLHIGAWRVFYEVINDMSRASSATMTQFLTLSTANNSESDVSMTAVQIFVATRATSMFHRERLITVAAKTSYYLNSKTNVTGMSSIDFRGDLGTTVVKAIPAFL